MGLFCAGLRLISYGYLGFADCLFGLHYLRFNLDVCIWLFWCFLCLRLSYIVI